jgi:DNA-binding LytR/AlgR family response regulator
VKTTLQILDADIRVVQFEDSDNAIDYIRTNHRSIDLLLLDVRVPGSTDGVGVAKKAVELECPGLIAFTSAYASPDSATLRGIEHVWLAKPVDLIRMRSVLKRARRGQIVRMENETAKSQPGAVPPEAPSPQPAPIPVQIIAPVPAVTDKPALEAAIESPMPSPPSST